MWDSDRNFGTTATVLINLIIPLIAAVANSGEIQIKIKSNFAIKSIGKTEQGLKNVDVRNKLPLGRHRIIEDRIFIRSCYRSPWRPDYWIIMGTNFWNHVHIPTNPRPKHWIWGRRESGRRVVIVGKWIGAQIFIRGENVFEGIIRINFASFPPKRNR